MEEMEPMANFKVADKRYYISTKKVRYELFRKPKHVLISFYCSNNFQANWYLAQRECAMRGLRLASIPSEEHDVAILQFIHDNGNCGEPLRSGHLFTKYL